MKLNVQFMNTCTSYLQATLPKTIANRTHDVEESAHRTMLKNNTLGCAEKQHTQQYFWDFAEEQHLRPCSGTALTEALLGPYRRTPFRTMH